MEGDNGNMILYFFDIKTKKWQTIEIADIIKEELDWNIKNFENRYGIKIELIGITNAEVFIDKYYRRKKYNILKLPPYNSKKEINENVYNLLRIHEDKNDEEIKKILNESGVPDFLVWNDNEVFFVEAKSWTDGVKGNQLVWIFSHNYPVKIFVQKIENNYKPFSRKHEDEDYEALNI